MSEEDKHEGLPLKKLLEGSVLILISNLIYVGNNYLVAWTQLTAPEVALVRGTLQVIIFGIIVWRSKGGTSNQSDNSEPKDKNLLLYFLVVLYGFTISTMSFGCVAAILMMPIGDLIVISFTSPVFSVFLDRIILKRPLTILSIFLCLFIVLGDILVVQPPFIFGSSSSSSNTSSNSSESQDDQSTEKRGSLYYLGVSLCLYAAAAAAVANVVNTQCLKMGVTTAHLMLVSGFSSLLLSFIASIFMSNRLLTSPQSLSLEAGLLLPASALIVMVAFWTMTLAVSVTRHPTLVSMLRSTEILISLVTESLWWQQIPDTLSLLGSLLVAACVLSMAAHDNIVAAAGKAWRKIRKGRSGKFEISQTELKGV